MHCPAGQAVAVVAVDPVVLHQHGASLGGKTAEAEIEQQRPDRAGAVDDCPS